jgi:hypothetical protein
MDLDTARFKPLSAQEKDRRRRLNLCLYCGEPNHMARQCPNKRWQMTANTLETLNPEEPSENDEVQM